MLSFPPHFVQAMKELGKGLPRERVPEPAPELAHFLLGLRRGPLQRLDADPPHIAGVVDHDRGVMGL